MADTNDILYRLTERLRKGEVLSIGGKTYSLNNIDDEFVGADGAYRLVRDVVSGDGIAPEPIKITGKEQWTTDEVVAEKPYKVRDVDTNDELLYNIADRLTYELNLNLNDKVKVIDTIRPLIQSDREKAVRNTVLDALIDIQISLMQMNKTKEQQRDETLDLVNKAIKHFEAQLNKEEDTKYCGVMFEHEQYGQVQCNLLKGHGVDEEFLPGNKDGHFLIVLAGNKEEA